MNDARPKIVLVDDNAATLSQGKSLLQSMYKVYTVGSAVTMFENLELDIPDLILLDVEMPDMNGFDAIEKLKADARYKDIPVIFVTSRSDEGSERKGFALGAVDYIAKPFSAPLLQKRISNQILYLRVQKAIKEYTNNIELLADEVIKADERAKFLMDKISNDVLVPMNMIIDTAELALSDKSQDGKDRHINAIRQTGQGLLKTVNDILDFSSTEAE